MKYIQHAFLVIVVILLHVVCTAVVAAPSQRSREWYQKTSSMDRYKYDEPRQAKAEPDYTLRNRANRVSESTANWPIAQIALYLLMAAVAVAAVLYVYNNVTFGKKKNRNVELLVEDKTSHEIAGDLELALSGKQYREAVRLQFLYTLSMLQNRSLITWRADTTNVEYCLQLNNSGFELEFARVARAFEDSWYGFKPTTIAEYELIASLSNKLTATV